jgi:hypothetical protein
MSTAQQLDLQTPAVMRTIRQRSLIVGGVFSLIALVLAFTEPNEFFHAYLISYMDWLGVALGSMALLMLRHLTGGGWGMVIRRILGAAMRTIPLLALFFIPICFALPRTYLWARPLDGIHEAHLREHLQHLTQAYLNPHGFIIRAVIYFAVWGAITFLLTKWSAEQDHPPVRDNSVRFKAVSGPGIILYGLTITFASIDWVMSIDPSWISTIYGLHTLAGQVLSALCFAVVVERILVRYKPMSEMLQKSFVHDHGKLMMAFIMVWAYFSFSQFLIIWAGNIPEEITWYVRRMGGGWGYVGIFLVLFHFAVPFVILLSRSFKRDVTRLVWLAAWMLVARYIDIFWMIEPNFSQTFRVTVPDLVLPFAIGGLWMAAFCHNLIAMPLLPAYDVFAKQVLEPAHE